MQILVHVDGGAAAVNESDATMHEWPARKEFLLNNSFIITHCTLKETVEMGYGSVMQARNTAPVRRMATLARVHNSFVCVCFCDYYNSSW